jgi:hypothetical protein
VAENEALLQRAYDVIDSVLRGRSAGWDKPLAELRKALQDALTDQTIGGQSV